MNPEIWRRLGRWLLAIVICLASLLSAVTFAEFLPLLDKAILHSLDGLKFSLPPEVGLSLLSLFTVLLALALWLVPSALAVGFALVSPLRSRWHWGLALPVLLTGAFLWRADPIGTDIVSKLSAATVVILIVCSIVFSLVRKNSSRFLFLPIILALVFLTAPAWIAVFLAAPAPPNAQKLWSVVLQKELYQAMNTGSEFNSRRQIVFAGDRLLVSFDAGLAPYEGAKPMSSYRLLSLDLQTGAVLNSQYVVGKWGEVPLLYATSDGKAILDDGSLKSLNPDLTDAGVRFAPDRGRIGHMSPDGSTMLWETFPGGTFVDSRTLLPMSRHLDESVPTSVSRRGILTDNIYWSKDYPQDRLFVTLTDSSGKHLIFHGQCGGRPEFLTDEIVIVAGCGRIRTIDVHGKLLHETKTLEGDATFAGVSQDGSRFAVEFTETRGDPPMPLYDHFAIYDTESVEPIAMVRITDLPEYYSWSALSADGQLFAVGNPNSLSLYRIPRASNGSSLATRH